MPEPHFISRELDRRIARAGQAIKQGSVNAAQANSALMPWAAAEAWIVGHGGRHAISPRDGISRADQLCPLADTIAELTRARDAVMISIDRDNRVDLGARFIGLTHALQDLHRLQTLRAAFAAGAGHRRTAAREPALPRPYPSLLADMFGPDGKPLPIERNAA
jgi:hypothetical protein